MNIKFSSVYVPAIIAAAALTVVDASTPDVLSFLFKVGTLGSGVGELNYPIGGAVGPANRIYVADSGNDRVAVFNANGTPAFTFGGTGSGTGQLLYPTGLAVDAAGRVLVADSDNNRLQLFDANGQWLESYGSFGNFDTLDPANLDDFGNYVGLAPTLYQFYWPSRVAIRPGTRLGDPTDMAGRVAVVDNGNHRIVMLSSTLHPMFSFGSFGSDGNALGEFEYPIGVGLDLQHVYVADPQNHRIQIFNQGGKGESFFGSVGAENSPDDLQNAYDVQPDGHGHLVIADTDRSRILILAADPAAPLSPRCSDVVGARAAGRCTIIGSTGTVYDARVLGNDGVGDSEFTFPQAVATDASARVVVFDTDNHRVQVFQGARLRVVGATVAPSGPVQSGQPVTLTVTLANQGATSLLATPAAIPSLPGQLTSPAAQNLAPGAQQAFTFTYVSNANGALTFAVSATGLTSTGVSAVDGPVTTAPLTVTPASGPKMLATIAATPAKVGPGGTIAVSVTIHNSGSVTLQNVTPDLAFTPASRVTLSQGPTPASVTLAPNGSRVFTYSFAGAPDDFGAVTFQAGAAAAYADATIPGGSSSITLPTATGPTTVANVVSDAQAPASIIAGSGTMGAAGWYTSTVQVRITATDNVSVAAINYRVDGLLGFSGRVPGSSAAFALTFEGGADVTYWAEDTAGNVESKRTAHFNIDSVAPSITRGGVSPAPNAAGWISAFPTVSFIGSDGGSGIASISPNQYVGTNGAAQTIAGRATDLAGNSAQTSVRLNVDTVAPTVACAPTVAPNALGWFTSQPVVTINCIAADQPGLSGLSVVRAICPSAIGLAPLTAGAPAGTATCAISAEGDHAVIGEATDVAGNRFATQIRIKIDRTPPTVVCGTASGGEIWPPNHKMVGWDTFVTVTDALSGSAGFKLVAYNSTEALNALADGNTGVDMAGWTLGTPDTDGFVRSERSGVGTGRLYRLRYAGTDAAGNVASCITMITTVPHDQGKQ